MKVRTIPKTLSDCIAMIIDLCNENEELKNRILDIESSRTKMAEAFRNIK